MSAKRGRFTWWLKGEGIEIGALHNPLPVPADVKVRYVDRLPVERLQEHYPDLDRPFVHIDVIAIAEDLSPIPDESLDFVIANHLVEHVEDPIRAFKEFYRVLKPDGALYLALPDQRQTFDRERRLTTLQHLLEEHESGTAETRRAHYEDWAINVDHQPPPATEYVDHQLDIGYSIHFHVFRPETFLQFYFAVKERFGLDFELVSFAGPENASDDEFIAVLLKRSSDRVRPARRVVVRNGKGAAKVYDPNEDLAVPTLRQALALSPVGPSVRTVRRLVTRLRDRS